jgi:hypothetical protein
MHKGQEGANMKMCYEFCNDGCKRDNMSRTRLLRGLLLEELNIFCHEFFYV